MREAKSLILLVYHLLSSVGLLDTIKAHCVDETGIAFLDTHGKVQATLGRNDSGQGPQSFTSEFEIIRGDLVRVLYQASLDAAAKVAAGRGAHRDDVLRYEFGKYATELAPRGDGSGIDVAFSDGSSGAFDLVVGADGQASRTRRMLFGGGGGGSGGSGRGGSDAALRPVGVHLAFYKAPRDPAEPAPMVAKVCHAPGRRLLCTRTGNLPFTQVLLATMAPGEALSRATAGGDVEGQKAALDELFRGAGWQSDGLLAHLKTTDDFYCQSTGQVKLERWHRGRVVLLADAGYCPSPITGMGTTAAFVGSYVLAGELARQGRGGGDVDVDAALEGYERVLRPFVDECQRLPWGQPGILYYETSWGIWLLHKIMAIATGLRIDKLLTRILPEDNGDWQIPDYPELNCRAT